MDRRGEPEKGTVRVNIWSLIVVVGLLIAGILFMTRIYWETRSTIKQMRELHKDVTFVLTTFNMRKSDIWVDLFENRRDIYQCRVEVAKVKAMMIPKQYHITLVPMLVPGELPPGVLPEGINERMEQK